jgi:hypothetical protein
MIRPFQACQAQTITRYWASCYNPKLEHDLRYDLKHVLAPQQHAQTFACIPMHWVIALSESQKNICIEKIAHYRSR